jgi:hypothetical protein
MAVTRRLGEEPAVRGRGRIDEKYGNRVVGGQIVRQDELGIAGFLTFLMAAAATRQQERVDGRGEGETTAFGAATFARPVRWPRVRGRRRFPP